MRRTEVTWVLLLAFVAALAVAAAAGLRNAPNRQLLDSRRSTLLSGPEGASGFAEAMEQLGVTVERRRRALFDVGDAAETGSWLAVLTLRAQRVSSGGLFIGVLPVSDVELRELMLYLELGGSLLLAGETGIERCFGFEVQRIPRAEGGEEALMRPRGASELPAAQYVWRAMDAPANDGSDTAPACEAPPIVSSRLLLRTVGRRPVAWRHEFEGGGRVIMLADSRFLSNRLLRETNVGPLVLGWLLSERPVRLAVDEHHQGFGAGGSLLRAAWWWMRTSPGGWAMLQLALAALLALSAAAVRFGPALKVVERRRRSPLEHLDALAVGLERAEGGDEAVTLIVEGLRRRLGRSGNVPRTPGSDTAQWLESLALAARDREARASVAQLGAILRKQNGDERVLEAATAVEDVWQALRPANSSSRS